MIDTPDRRLARALADASRCSAAAGVALLLPCSLPAWMRKAVAAAVGASSAFVVAAVLAGVRLRRQLDARRSCSTARWCATGSPRSRR